MCIAAQGGGGRGSLCTVHTIKSIDTGEQIFETLLQVKITIVKIP
jgi:hypothetical protein